MAPDGSAAFARGRRTLGTESAQFCDEARMGRFAWVRVPGPLLIVVIVVVAAALVGALTLFGGRGGHVPHSSDEIAATAYAQAYARTLDAHRPDLACQLATHSAADKLGCGSAHPRGLPPCGSGAITVSRTDPAHAEVKVAACKLTLAPSGDGWKITDDTR